MRSSFIISLVKLFLFIILVCFLYTFTIEFIREINIYQRNSSIFIFAGIFFSFFFYIFIADLNNLYKAIQNFFFRTYSLSLIISIPLALTAFLSFILPRLCGLNIEAKTFFFINGFLFAAHMIFIARNKKGTGFVGYVNYLFYLGVLYLINLFLLGTYLEAYLRIDLMHILSEGIRKGYAIFSQLYRRIF